VQTHQFLGYEQSQSKALTAVVNGIRVLKQPFKNQRDGLRADTSASIGDRDIHEVGIGRHQGSLYRHRSVCRSEFDSVINQVDQNFQDAVRIPVHERNAGIQPHFQPDLLLASDGLHHGHCLPDQVSNRHRVRLNRIFPVSARSMIFLQMAKPIPLPGYSARVCSRLKNRENNLAMLGINANAVVGNREHPVSVFLVGRDANGRRI
jgi:hypothetical protein